MQSDLSDVTIIVDRSGSMRDIQSDAEGGVNTFIEQQKRDPGRTVFSLVQFDHEYQMIHNGVPVADVPHYTLVPRGNTALFDAVGRTINTIGERLKGTPEHARPGLVVVVIVTDGKNNASTEFTQEKIRAMIAHQTDTYKWQFTYLGANQDAFQTAGGMGIAPQSAGNYAPAMAGLAFTNAARNVSRMKAATAGGQHVTNSYTAEERAAMSAPVPPIDPAPAGAP